MASYQERLRRTESSPDDTPSERRAAAEAAKNKRTGMSLDDLRANLEGGAHFAKGSAQALAGSAGDIESILRLLRILAPGDTKFSTTEDIKRHAEKHLPSILPENASEERKEGARQAEMVGEFFSPLGVLKGLLKGGKAVVKKVADMTPGPASGGLAAQRGSFTPGGGGPSRPPRPSREDPVEGPSGERLPEHQGTGRPSLAEQEAQAGALRDRDIQAPTQSSRPERYQSGEMKGKYVGTEGFWVGGKKGVTPQMARQMREQYKQKMEAGKEGRYWYDDASDLIYRLVGENPTKADQLAATLAITSSTDRVQSNLGHGLRGWNQRAVGVPVSTGKYPPAMSASIERVLSDPEAAATGLKRNPFSAGLSVRWRGEDVQRATHDRHDINAWGVRGDAAGNPSDQAPSDAGHRFLDPQMDKVIEEATRDVLGGVTDWNHYRGQAAAWVAQKAIKDNISIEEASKSFADLFADYTAQITREWIPTNTGHLPEAKDAALALRQGYHDDMERIVTGQQGTDLLAQMMGGLSDRTLPNRGWYEKAQWQPGSITQLGVGRDAGAVDEASLQAARSIASGHAILGTQNQAAFNASPGNKTPEPIRSAGAYHVDLGRPMNDAELTRLNALVEAQARPQKKDLDLIAPQADIRGGRVLESAPHDYEGRKRMVAALRKEFPEGRIVTRPNQAWISDDLKRFSYRPFIDEVKAGGDAMVGGFNRAMQTMAPQALDKTRLWAANTGWSIAPWFPIAMEALAKGGLQELDRLQRAGVVPVAFITGVAALLAGGSMGSPEEGSQGA